MSSDMNIPMSNLPTPPQAQGASLPSGSVTSRGPSSSSSSHTADMSAPILMATSTPRPSDGSQITVQTIQTLQTQLNAIEPTRMQMVKAVLATIGLALAGLAIGALVGAFFPGGIPIVIMAAVIGGAMGVGFALDNVIPKILSTKQAQMAAIEAFAKENEMNANELIRGLNDLSAQKTTSAQINSTIEDLNENIGSLSSSITSKIICHKNYGEKDRDITNEMILELNQLEQEVNQLRTAEIAPQDTTLSRLNELKEQQATLRMEQNRHVEEIRDRITRLRARVDNTTTSLNTRIPDSQTARSSQSIDSGTAGAVLGLLSLLS